MDRKRVLGKTIVFSVFIAVIAMVCLLIRNYVFEIIKLANNNDFEEIKTLLIEKGLFGVFLVVGIEALGMVVIFLPAEFAQISAGMSFPWFIAIILCLAGVFIGASIIYLLVNFLKFKPEQVSKSEKRIKRMTYSASKNLNTRILMYLLFIMPVIPFGAICYYGSSTKIGYKKYILTCVTGVIPSILTSIVMSKAIVFCVADIIPGWLLAVVIAVLAVLLFVTVALIIRRMFGGLNGKFLKNILYDIVYKVVGLYVFTFARVTCRTDKLENIDEPVIFLANHASDTDVYCMAKLVDPYRMKLIFNRYYYRIPVLRKILTKIEFVPKSLFNADLETVKGCLKLAKRTSTIVMFPEGRLSADGTSYGINEGLGQLLKMMKTDVAVVNINGSYLLHPKWRKKRTHGRITVDVKEIITKDDVQAFSAEQLEEKINNDLRINDFAYARDNGIRYRCRNKAKGLDGILYRCPKCGKEFTLVTEGDAIRCSSCGFEAVIGRDYSFEDNECGLRDISEWYETQRESERKNVAEGTVLSCSVKARKLDQFYPSRDVYGEGVITLEGNRIRFDGEINGEKVSFGRELQALAYSCSEEFEFYDRNVLYYFYPKEEPRLCAKYALYVDMANERRTRP